MRALLFTLLLATLSFAQTAHPAGCLADFECPLFYMPRLEHGLSCEKGSSNNHCFDPEVWGANIKTCCIRDIPVIKFLKKCMNDDREIHRVRKPLSEWTPEMKTQFSDAWNKMHNEMHKAGDDTLNLYLETVRFHENMGHQHGAPIIHSGDLHLSQTVIATYSNSFLPWHRYFLFETETNLAYLADDCSLTLPYVPNHIFHTKSKPHIWGENQLYGKLELGAIRTGLAADWDYPPGSGEAVTREPNPASTRFGVYGFDVKTGATYEQFAKQLEQGSAEAGYQPGANHNTMHGLVGGNMVQMYSPSDPIFYLHHAWVDYKWWEWQVQGALERDQCDGCTENEQKTEGLMELDQFITTYEDFSQIKVDLRDTNHKNIQFKLKIEYKRPDDVPPPEDCEEFDVTVTSVEYGNEMGFDIGGQCHRGGDFPNHETTVVKCCMPPGAYNMDCYDSYGDGWVGASGNPAVGTISVFGEEVCKLQGNSFMETVAITVPDSSAPPVVTCNPGEEKVSMLTSVLADGHEMAWHILETDCQQSNFAGHSVQECCLAPGEYTVQCTDHGNNGWSGGSLRMQGDVTGKDLCSVTGGSQTNTVAVAYTCADRPKQRAALCGFWNTCWWSEWNSVCGPDGEHCACEDDYYRGSGDSCQQCPSDNNVVTEAAGEASWSRVAVSGFAAIGLLTLMYGAFSMLRGCLCSQKVKDAMKKSTQVTYESVDAHDAEEI